MKHALSIIVLAVLSASAQADWTLTEHEGTTIATLHGVISMTDAAKFPEADIYVLNSGGGNLGAAHIIVGKLKDADTTVVYQYAASAAAYIVTEMHAKPINKQARLGFHWATFSDNDSELTISQVDSLERWNTKIVNSITNHFKVEHAAKIIAHMSSIFDAKQGSSMVTVTVNGTMSVIRNGIKQ